MWLECDMCLLTNNCRKYDTKTQGYMWLCYKCRKKVKETKK